MSKSIKVNAVLIPAARDMRIEAGQHILVVAGMAVGVYTGHEDIPLAPPPQQTVHSDKSPYNPTAKAAAAPPAKKKLTKSERGALGAAKMDGSPVSTVAPIVNALRVFLKERGDIGRSDLLVATGISFRDKHFWRVRDAIRYLMGVGEIEGYGGNKDRRYRLVKKVQPA